MKLVIIYGPPAIGKLTVAKELSALTDYKLFHNHLTVDLVASLFSFGTPAFWENLHYIREYLFEEAASNDVNLIFTYVYAAGEDDKIIHSYISIIEKHGGEVCLVQLKASLVELKKRIVKKERSRYTKMTSAEELEKWFAKYDLFSKIPGRESLVIDNTKLTPKIAARRISQQYQLQQS